MKTSFLGALVLLFLSSILYATAAETTDLDVALPLEILEGQEEQTPDELSVAQTGVLDAAAVITPAEEQPRVSDKPQYYYISYSKKDIAQSQEVLQKQLDILYYIYEHQYLAHASERDLQRLQKQGYVVDYRLVRENKERYTVGPLERENFYYVYAFRESDVSNIKSALADLSIPLVTTNSYVVVIDLSTVQDKEDILYQIVGVEGVEAVEQKPHYEPTNDRTNIVVGTETIRSRYQLFGSGQIIAIADMGLDTGVLATLHPDIRGRVISLVDIADPLGCTGLGNPNDPSGHGTAVTGAAIGNGVQSGSNPSQHVYTNSYAGSAPEARLVFQAVGCDNGGISIPIPPNTMLFAPAYQQGARIHSNSYSTNVGDGSYAYLDREVDRYTALNKEFTIVFGGGNANGVGTVGATAKNALIVGGFMRDQPNTQIYARGPTRDGRFKPDILSAAIALIGTGITTTYSSVQTLPGCAQLSTNPAYCELAGTSIAAPNVAGAAALVREYFMTRRSVTNPSSALIKATILNGGVSMYNGLPDTNYGWGRMNLADSLINNMYWDFAFWDSRTGLTTNSARDHTIYVEANGRPLRATLVWTDKEGSCITNNTTCQTAPKLVNNLNLEVIAPNGQRYNGNDLTTPYDDTWDTLNNVERVEILSPIQGMYTLRVRAQNVPLGSQDFALAVTYDNLLIQPAPVAQICMIGGIPC